MQCINFYWFLRVKITLLKKVKQSHYRPGQALRVPGGWGSQISRQSAHEGGKVVSPTNRPPLPPGNYSWYSFLLEAESTPGPKCGRKYYVNEKNLMKSSGIETATFRLLAQCPNQLHHRVPHSSLQIRLNFPDSLPVSLFIRIILVLLCLQEAVWYVRNNN